MPNIKSGILIKGGQQYYPATDISLVRGIGSFSGLFSGTTQYWNSQIGYMPKAGEIIIYTDYKTITENNETKLVPGIKIGSGNGYVQDLAFIGETEAKQLLDHINNSDIHITSAERTAWNNKLNVNDIQETEGEILIFNRN